MPSLLRKQKKPEKVCSGPSFVWGRRRGAGKDFPAPFQICFFPSGSVGGRVPVRHRRVRASTPDGQRPRFCFGLSVVLPRWREARRTPVEQAGPGCGTGEEKADAPRGPGVESLARKRASPRRRRVSFQVGSSRDRPFPFSRFRSLGVGSEGRNSDDAFQRGSSRNEKRVAFGLRPDPAGPPRPSVAVPRRQSENKMQS